MLTLFMNSIKIRYPSSDFYLKPVFLRGFSGLLHLLLVTVLCLVWFWKRIQVRSRDINVIPLEGIQRRRIYNKFGRKVVLCCLGLSGFSIVLCCLNYFYWYGSGWTDDKLVSLLDFGLKALAWLGISIYLHGKFSNHGDQKLPLLFRTWWNFFLVISCYILVIDFVDYGKDVTLPINFVVSDVVSIVAGFFFCYVRIWLKNDGGDEPLEEPLLNGNDDNVNTTKLGDTVTPYSNAGIFSVLTFSWMGSLMAVGNKKILDLEDVPHLDVGDTVLTDFENMLGSGDSRNIKVTSLKLSKFLIISMWREILFTGVLALVGDLASYVGPFLIDTFVRYLSRRRDFNNQGYALVFAFIVSKLVGCFSQRINRFKLKQVGIRTQAVLIGKIYKKGLTLSSKSRQSHSSGEVINFITADAERIGSFSGYIHDPWLIILEVTLAMLILYKNLGIASFAALFATILVMLANIPLMKVQEKFQGKLMESKDKRMKSTSEILRNMRILKLQGWEMKFLSKILELRKDENGWLKKYLYISAVSIFVFWGAPTFVSVATFGTCVLMGIPLEAGKILSAIATFRILQQAIYDLPDLITTVVQTKVSVDRLASFFQLEDLDPDVIEKLPSGISNTSIEIINGNFSWDISSTHPTLKDINFKVWQGMRVAICGTVGSGKSSLLSCILGEVPKISGIVKLSGTKAYVAQSPWIQSGKIEDNILFGKEMDRQKYERILDACSLKKDLESMSFGDQTVVGERGINLSGGQKQRIQIARALYQDADIYLFDDPFSAVDAHTGSHLFKECLLGVLSSKTVIYVTHQVEFLPAADLILVMKDGRITQAGEYNNILDSGTDFFELVGAHKKALLVLDPTNEGAASEVADISKEHNEESVLSNEEEKDVQSFEVDGDDDAVIQTGQLIHEEEREKGRVGLSVYRRYIRTAYGGAFVPFILLGQILYQILQIGSNYWMASATPLSADEQPPVQASTLLIVYAALAVGSSFCVLARTSLVATAAFITASQLFNKLHHCIFRAPMSFFDSTPSGRILNRASTDQTAVDLRIASEIYGVAASMIRLLGTIAVMSQVTWQVFVIFIPVTAASIWYQQYYLPSARELSRLVGISKAPVIQHFVETISGSTTIRSFDQESRFQETNMNLMDGYSRIRFHVAAAMGWLCFRLDMLSCLTFAFSLVFLISVPAGVIDPSIAGLVVSYGLTLNTLQVVLVLYLCDAENQIISVERIFQYSNIRSEPPLVIDGNQLDNSWPSKGAVDVHNLQVKYAPHLPLVLRGLTCTFRGGEKIGIVGRTGSGKSTLVQTLFRIVEPSAGQIIIDGINICSIGLHDLRSRLSIIPQDPTMFEGTVRTNLDPLEEYTDQQIWEALDKCQLGDEIRKKENKLYSTVTENGENWSMGQRQLVCLGRVLLKKNKILVLDEATASVDTATDSLMQETLKKHFIDSTVITIAHRITSILDSDMVLVLDNGLITEYDAPSKLLENKVSSFAQLVAEYTARSNPRL